jgi:hypothetical protein
MNTNLLELDEIENQVEDWTELTEAEKWHLIAQVETLLTEPGIK